LAKSSSAALGISSPPQLDVIVAADAADIVDVPAITLMRDASPAPDAAP
jgi:hypothetical protein